MSAPDTLDTTVGEPRSPRRLLAWRRLRLPRYTIRLRLALLYSGVFLVLGTLLLAITFLSVRHSSHSVVVSAQGAASKLKQREGGEAAQAESPLSVVPESLARQHASAQADQLGKLAADVNRSDLHQLLIWSVLALAIMAVAAVALGWLLAGRVLRPLQVITAAARQLSATNLHERLALDGPNDELRELGDTFDGLLERLDASFAAQRQFVSNASHELRTPLTLERAILEVTLADPDATAASLRAACERVLAIGEQQERTIGALLTLANSERGVEHHVPLLLDELAGKVLDERREEIACHGLRLDSELQRAPIVGDRALVERLIANLLDNAIQHNSHDGWLSVASSRDEGEALLTVTNSGLVIAPEQLPSLLRPFQRLGVERTSHEGGHGLGLSIVDAIATAHHAELTIHAQPAGGLRVEVRFKVV